MREQLVNAISSGFYGEWTHIDPKKALANLTPTIARKKPENMVHSCWELLHHIVIWQESIIKNIKGDSLDWNEIVAKQNWPTPEVMKDDSNFSKLLDRFFSGVKEATNLLNGVDFTKKSVGFPELSTIKLYIVLLQHTSYHNGQIITVRKSTGDWPPITNES